MKNQKLRNMLNSSKASSDFEVLEVAGLEKVKGMGAQSYNSQINDLNSSKEYSFY
jgi:hypothetical protein